MIECSHRLGVGRTIYGTSRWEWTIFQMAQSTDDCVSKAGRKSGEKDASVCSSQETADLISDSDLRIPFLTRSLLEQMQIGMRAGPRQKEHEGV